MRWRRLTLVILLLALFAIPPVAAQTTPPKPPIGSPKPVPFNDAPEAVLIAQLDANLRAGAPDAYAGLRIAEDRALEVYTTTYDSRFAEIVRTTTDSVRQSVSPQPLPALRIISGMRNSIRILEQLRDQITSRRKELVARGVLLRQWGVDVRSNTVRIGVAQLPEQVRQLLEQEFGRDRISVFYTPGFTTASRSADSSPYFGGIPIVSAGGTPCTSGFNVLVNLETVEMMTAGHCPVGDWYHNSTFLAQTDQWQLTDGQRGDWQTAFYRNNQTGAGYVWIAETIVRHVASMQLVESVGDAICTDGYFTGEHCGGTISSINQCIMYGDPYLSTICGLTVADMPNTPAVLGGDSGGPVYNYRTDGDLNASGLINAGTIGGFANRFAYCPWSTIREHVNVVVLG